MRGEEFLVTVDDRLHPDILTRVGTSWASTKARGPTQVNAKTTAQDLLGGLGEDDAEDHTQQLIKRLVLAALARVTNRFFAAARW